jgi:drug/metabolite transporter (DMT)-like permease
VIRWFWLLLATALEVFADYLLKRWSLGAGTKFAISGFLIYGIGGIGWGYLLRHETLQRAIVLFVAVNVFAVIVMGHYVFGERMSIKELAAAILVVLAVALTEY